MHYDDIGFSNLVIKKIEVYGYLLTLEEAQVSLVILLRFYYLKKSMYTFPLPCIPRWEACNSFLLRLK